MLMELYQHLGDGGLHLPNAGAIRHVGFKKSDELHQLSKQSQDNFFTVFLYLWNKEKKLGFKFISLRNLNQDPLEIFFGYIRSHGVRNINPMCDFFVNSFKTLIVSNFTSRHSTNDNCVEDDSLGALNGLKHFLYNKMGFEDIPLTPIPAHPDLKFSMITKNHQTFNSHPYLVGYMARRVFIKIVRCENCRHDLFKNSDDNIFEMLEARATRPNSNFVNIFRKCNDVLHYFLPKICCGGSIRASMIKYLQMFVSNNFTCQEHDMFSIFINMFVPFYIHMWVKNINKVLKAIDSRKTAINDPIKKAAALKSLKFKRTKHKINKSKFLQ
ncbi:hypothetical protein FQA39_LY04715 [Lamprigera yunnana]|nr:hypothetical protein FQA39_LY04715 [Lamprigera yunnana]